MKIGLKLILIIVILVAISVLATGLFYYFTVEASLQERIGAQLESVATLKKNQLNDFLEDSIKELEGVAADKSLIDDFSKIKDTSVDYNMVNMADHKKVNEFLKNELLYNENYIEFFIVNNDWRVHVSTDEKQVGKFKSGEPYFNKGKEGPYVQSFYYDTSLQKPALTISVPLKNTNGKVIGVLAGRINLDKVSKIIMERSGLGETGETYLVNKFNLIVSEVRDQKEVALKSTTYTSGVQSCLKGNGGYSLYNDYKNIPVIGYYTWIPEREICLLAEIDQQEAFAPVAAFRNTAIFISLGILLLVIFLGRIISKIITKPIIKLGEVAKKVSAGNLKVKAEVNSKDEVGQLTSIFNEMIERLLKNTEELETKVKERTTELNQKVVDLENSKKATINLLEDIQEEKNKVEAVVVERTKELSSEKARLLASINSLSFGFIIADMDHHVLVKNNAIKKLFGLKDEGEMSINNLSEILGNRLDIKAQVELCLKDKMACEIKEITFDAKFFRAIIAPIFISENNQTIGYVFLLEDITEARAVDKAKTEFVSLASHQLRTPLSAINWYTEMLLSGDAGKLNPEQTEFLGDIISSSNRMSSLVGTLLNVSRIELGTFAVTPLKKDLCEIIKDEVEDLKVQIEEKKIEMEYIFSLKPAFVFVDPKLMSIVIQNFLTNAIKYNFSGGKISISVDKLEKSEEVVLSIIDTGHGIPKANQEKIFTKMYRAQNAVAIDPDGNGLGLYMVKSILETSGCQISFESPPKGKRKGTAFYIHIPKEGMKHVKATKHLGSSVS